MRYEKTDTKWLVKRESDGVYYARRSISGKRRLDASLYTTDYQEAKERFQIVMAEYTLGIGVKKSEVIHTVGDAVVGLTEILKGKSKAYQTSLEVQWAHLSPYFKDLDVRTINDNEIDRYKATQRTATPGRKLKHDLEWLRRILKYAQVEGWTEHRLTIHIGPEDQSDEPGKDFTDEEIAKLYQNSNRKWKLLEECLIVTGARKGDIFHLKHSQIDQINRALTIYDSKRRRRRTIPIDDELLRKLLARRGNDSEYVFPNARDKHRPMHSSSAWYRILERAGVRGRIHDYRHTNVTTLVKAGFAPKLICQTRGMTEKILERYTHSDLNLGRQMAEVGRKRLGNVWGTGCKA